MLDVKSEAELFSESRISPGERKLPHLFHNLTIPNGSFLLAFLLSIGSSVLNKFCPPTFFINPLGFKF